MYKLSSLLLVLIMLLLTASCAPMRDLSVAPQGTQSIVIWHRQSGERIDVTTRNNGHYNPAAFEQIDHIFRDRHTGEEYPVDPRLIDALAELRDKLLMSPSDPIELLSGYRSPESNGNLAKTNKYVAKNSYHMKGKAADIRIPDMSSSALEAVAKTMQKGGVALYPDGGPDFGHVHVDTGPVRGWSVVHGQEPGFRQRMKERTEKHVKEPAAKPAPVKPKRDVLKVRPLNSYDELPEPAHPLAPAHTPKKTDPHKGAINGKREPIKTPVKPPVKPAVKPAVKPPLKPASHKSLEDAKKQWVKTPYHKPDHTSEKAPAHKPVLKDTDRQ